MTALHAARVAARLRRELSVDVEMRRGPYGKFEVLVDEETAVDGGALAMLGILPSAREIVVSVRARLEGAPEKRALEDHLRAYLRAWNKSPTPFEWTKPARAIIKSHKRMLDRISTAVH